MHHPRNILEFMDLCIAFCQPPQRRQYPFATTVDLSQLERNPIRAATKLAKNGCGTSPENERFTSKDEGVNLLIWERQNIIWRIAFNQNLSGFGHDCSTVPRLRPLRIIIIRQSERVVVCQRSGWSGVRVDQAVLPGSAGFSRSQCSRAV